MLPRLVDYNEILNVRVKIQKTQGIEHNIMMFYFLILMITPWEELR